MQKLTRRHVIATFSASSVTLCPAVLNAAVYGWADGFTDDAPQGQDRLVNVSGSETVDITDLAPGEMAVLARANSAGEFTNTGGTQYVGVLHRTAEQIAAGAGAQTQDERYLVVNLVCPHRGFAIGLTDDPNTPFACTKTGGRHGSIFNAAGVGVGGASDDGDALSVPGYALTVGSTVTIALT